MTTPDTSPLLTQFGTAALEEILVKAALAEPVDSPVGTQGACRTVQLTFSVRPGDGDQLLCIEFMRTGKAALILPIGR